MERNRTKCLGSIEDDRTSEIVFTVGVGFKPTHTQCGKTLLLLIFFKKLIYYVSLFLTSSFSFRILSRTGGCE